MKVDRFMIAAPKSGSGKTMITCALLQILKDMGKTVASYKCGPDYIDPMFHRKVLGVPSKNLDTFFTDDETTRELFLSGRPEGTFAVLEGVMGLYDGLGGIYEQGSSYHLAKVTRTPIILVVDAKGMGKSVLALISGFLRYDTEHLIKGVLLNRMSKGYHDIIKPLIEEELCIKVIGYFPEQKDLHLESRHLGLVMPDELADTQKYLRELADRMKTTIDINEVCRLAAGAAELATDEGRQGYCGHPDGWKRQDTAENRCRIAVAMDEAFCFYYADNLRLLENYGADLQYFSPIHDRELPKNCDAVLLGGGYPELYAKELSENITMRAAVKAAFESGMPMVAECGGFLYLHSFLQVQTGENGKETTVPFAGVLDAGCYRKERLVRFGYVELKERSSSFLPENETIRAHEFHYYDSTDNGNACIATKPATGRQYPCVISGEAYWFGFPHLYYPSNPHFAEAFVKKAQKYKERGCQKKVF